MVRFVFAAAAIAFAACVAADAAPATGPQSLAEPAASVGPASEVDGTTGSAEGAAGGRGADRAEVIAAPEAPLARPVGAAAPALTALLTLFVLAAVFVVLSRKGLLFPRASRPGEPPVSPRVGPEAMTAGQLALGGVALWIATPLVGSLLVAIAAAQRGVDPQTVSEQIRAGGDPLAPLLSTVPYAVSIALVVVLIFAVRASGPTLGLRLPGAQDLKRTALLTLLIVPVVIVAGMLMQALVVLLAAVTGSEAPSAIAHDTLEKLTSAPLGVAAWATIVGVTIGAPFVEEVIYRGCIQTAFRRASGRATRAGSTIAVVCTTVIFVLPHLPVVPWHAVPVLALLSLMLGVAYERTGSLWVPIGVHALFNAANVALALS